MIQFLAELDKEIFLFLNSFHSPFWDKIMWWVSLKYVWVPLYSAVLFFIFYLRHYKTAIVALLSLILLVTLTDQTSVHLFKQVFERLRPCHNPDIGHLVHIVNDKCGGQFGFVSSHAANTFGFATFTSLFFRNRYFSVFIVLWAAIVSYSRIYLGVHFPGDIIGGMLLGIVSGTIVYRVYSIVVQRIERHREKHIKSTKS